MDWKSYQSDLIYQLGLLLAPLQDVADHPDHHDNRSKVAARAKYSADKDKFMRLVSNFVYDQSPGLRYDTEYNRVSQALIMIGRVADGHIDQPEVLAKSLKTMYKQAFEAIVSIPVIPTSDVLEAHSPFSAYLFMKDLCQTVSERLILTDRYAHPSLFYRYLRDVPSDVQVVFITWPRSKHGNNGKQNLSAYMDISRDYAAEKGPDNYLLVTNPEIHDRWLGCDDRAYQLGGSLKDAGRRSSFTVAELDKTKFQEGIEKLINEGREIFGSNQQTHP